MIVDKGFEKENNLLNTNLTKGAIGDDNTAPSASDTALGNEITSVTVTDSTVSSDTFTTKFTINSVTANGKTIKEVGLKFSDDTLYTRETHPDLEKTSSDEIIYFYKVVRQRA